MTKQQKKTKPKKHHQVKIIGGELYYKPFSHEAIKKAELFKHNQLVHFNPVGEMDEGSVRQMGLYWQACEFTSERVDNVDWSTQTHVDFQCRMELKFFDLDFIYYDERTRQVHFKLLSISFDNLPQIKRTNYFNNAFEVMANKIPYDGFYSVDQFIIDVKNSCKGNRK